MKSNEPLRSVPPKLFFRRLLEDMPHQNDGKLKKRENKEFRILERRTKKSPQMSIDTDLEQGCVTGLGSSQYRLSDVLAADNRRV